MDSRRTESGKKERGQIVIDCQAWPLAFSPEGKEFAKAHNAPVTSVAGYVEWFGLSYPLDVKADPIPGWNKRLASLRDEKNPHVALKKYSDFMHQTEKFRDFVVQAVAQLEAYIDQQVDMARGN